MFMHQLSHAAYLFFHMFCSVCLYPLNVEIICCQYSGVELTNAKYNLAASCLNPSCLLSAPAITNFFPSQLIPVHLFFLTCSPSITHFPASISSSIVSLLPSSLRFSLFLLSSHPSPASPLPSSTPISLPSSYLSRSLSGVEEAEYHLEKIALADMLMHSCTNTHTHTHTQVSSAIHCRVLVCSC